MVAGNSKILEQAQKSANMLSQQVKGLDGNERPDARETEVSRPNKRKITGQ